MPELSEEMYCSQQICIPPAFPYLLRQYAKAAIRTQPTDLLKWSTAYFRCLALNLPPPVKPRLEYPIPLNYYGLTPGWLKALVNQMHNAETVSFKLLWDRWVGACLKHNTLIEILLLGRFTDNKAIPWWRFIALCAGHLTENLTHTMVMVCEILTEEPEGGSAMISVKAFMDIYRFLAEIDASKAQHLPNIYFTDASLGLYEEQEEEKSAEYESTTEVAVTIDEVEEEKELSVSIMEEETSMAVISCPDIAAEEAPLETLDQTAFPPKGTEVLPESIDKTFALGAEGVEATEEDDENQKEIAIEPEDEEAKKEVVFAKHHGEEEMGETEGKKDNEGDDKPHSPDSGSPGHSNDEKAPEEDEETRVSSFLPSNENINADDENQDEIEKDVLSAEDEDLLDSAGSSKEDIVESPDVDTKGDVMTKNGIDVAGYQSVDTVQEDTTGRFKPKEGRDLPGEPITQPDVDSEGAAAADMRDDQLVQPNENDEIMGKEQDPYEGGIKGSYEISLSGSGEEYDGEKKADEDSSYLPRYEWFDVPAVPGIGPTVPIELVEIVDEFMTKMAKIQHGVVMPRNIRHFSCPPLEVFDLQDEY